MISFAHPRLAVTGLLLAAIFGPLANAAHAQDPTSANLAILRTALDQVAAGKSKTARILLESSAAQRPLSPETAALLAYLQEKAGDAAAAKATLNSVQQPTGVTFAYLSRLGGGASGTNPGGGIPTIPTGAVPTTASGGSTPSTYGNNPARAAASNTQLTRLEGIMWRLVNDDRRKNGLADLSYDDNLAEVARAHSAEMRDKKYFAHESPTAGLVTPLDRYLKANLGGQPEWLAENIYHAYGSRSMMTDQDTKEAEAALMNSPGHKANILHKSVTRIGIGFAADATGNIWVTQMFATGTRY